MLDIFAWVPLKISTNDCCVVCVCADCRYNTKTDLAWRTFFILPCSCSCNWWP